MEHEMKIFIGDGREVFIDFIESSPINFNSNFILKSFIVFTAAVILLVNGSIIRGLISTKWTFVNLMILADCCNAVAHIPVILQYIWRVVEDPWLCMTGFGFNRLMVVMNRTIPVAIALYRYALVFYYDLMFDTKKKKMLEMILAVYTAVIPMFAAVLSMVAPNGLNRFNVCMGREETYFLERNLLNSFDFSQENLIQLAVAAFCYSFVPLVPYCYVRIYRFRKNQKKLGLPERETKYRENLKRRNIVTFRYNMTIWLLDTTTMLLALITMFAIPDYFEVMVVVTVLVTCGLNPALYILGMRDDRRSD